MARTGQGDLPKAAAAMLFGREWLRAPLRVGAIAPSGPRLAECITRHLTPDDAPVIELGPGTGTFTRAILARGIPEQSLVLVERGPAFAAHLRRAFPDAAVLEADASALALHLPFGRGGAGAVICGLPFRSMPRRVVYRIVRAAFANLRAGAGMYLFTYGASCPVGPQMLERLGLISEPIARTLANLPPARVYCLRRKGEPPAS